MTQPSPPTWQNLLGQVVVLDVSSPFVYVGRLIEQQHDYLLLEEVDVHDLRDTSTTREQYVTQVKRLGLTSNRRWAWVRLSELVGLSRLEDVIES